MKNKTILKQALLFNNNGSPTYSKIKQLYEKAIDYQMLNSCAFLSAKPRQEAKILDVELFFNFIDELVENKTINNFNDLEEYLSASTTRLESIQNQGDSKNYYAKVFNKTLLFKKRTSVAKLYTEENIGELQDVEKIVVIENAESFLNIDHNRYDFPYENFIYLGGHANSLTRAFLQDKTLLFFIDFDIVSMNMYEDFVCKTKELFIPSDLEERYFRGDRSNKALYKKQRGKLRENYKEEALEVISLIKRYHAVVEQEVVQ